MKRAIKSSSYISGMAFTRKQAIQRLQAFSKQILEHISKCILYGKVVDKNKYDHWVEDEIGTWIYDSHLLETKNKRGLKFKDYQENLFGEFGTSLVDAKINLDLQYSADRKSANPYPKIDISKSMVEDMYTICSKISTTFSKILSENTDLTKAEIIEELHRTLDIYCLGGKNEN